MDGEVEAVGCRARGEGGEEATEKEHEADRRMRREAEAREVREKKLECVHRAKAAIEENPDALRKEKWPHCPR